MWQILHASYWKFIMLSNSEISFNWPIIDEVATRSTTAYLLAHSEHVIKQYNLVLAKAQRFSAAGKVTACFCCISHTLHTKKHIHPLTARVRIVGGERGLGGVEPPSYIINPPG